VRASATLGWLRCTLCLQNIRELGLAPGFYLHAHAVEVPQHLINANGQRVLQGEILGVFGQYGWRSLEKAMFSQTRYGPVSGGSWRRGHESQLLARQLAAVTQKCRRGFAQTNSLLGKVWVGHRRTCL